jgi:hypothetical protein
VEEVTGDCGKVSNEELKDWYCLQNIWVSKTRLMRWQGMWHIWGRREIRTGFWWGNEGKRPLGTLRHGWEYNIKMEFK